MRSKIDLQYCQDQGCDFEVVDPDFWRTQDWRVERCRFCGLEMVTDFEHTEEGRRYYELDDSAEASE